jgi:WS/DGAT/MGAT family acyltransferase
MFVKLARLGHPLHTLKLLLLDPTLLGRQLTLDDVSTSLAQNLANYPRLGQRVLGVAPFNGRPFWVPAAELALEAHLDERSVPPGSDRSTLDAICSQLATLPLDPHRPLWRLTLVSGLSGGQQAVIVQVHHAIGDGLSAMNTLREITTSEPGADRRVTAIEGSRSEPIGPSSARQLRQVAAADTVDRLADLPRLLLDSGRSAVRGVQFRSRQQGQQGLPRLGFHAHETFCTTRIGPSRVCASGELSLADVKAVGKATGTTVNGVLHGVLAAALRAELLERGESVDRPLIAEFGVAQNGSSQHRWGNFISPTTVYLHTDETDPLTRLLRTGNSAREAVAFRRAVGLDIGPRWRPYMTRAVPAFVQFAGYRIPSTAHVVTANVPGPATERWIGRVRVADWRSFAILVPPIGLNVTVHGYADRLNIGVLTAPEVTTHPEGLVVEMQRALAELADRAGVRVAVEQESARKYPEAV